MANITLYHNPRCSKSRQTLALLEARGETVQIVLYLDSPPSATALRDILAKLGLSARELLRKGESVYKELELGKTDVSDAQLIKAMVANPILIERPIAVCGKRAVLGRPPENVLELLN